MLDISDELLYTLNLPFPPAYTLCQDPSSTYKVPDYFGYECASTRWIIAMITNHSSLKRLIKCGKNFEHIFSRYYQIPDRPLELMGSDYPLETPAYHQQCVLYLTPLALALYMKQKSAVETLLELRNESGRKMVHPAEACFVQRVFRKGDTRMTNELYNTFPIIIAIRRAFFEGISLMVENGFTPQKQFSVIYRKSFRENVTLFRDVIDYVVELLRHKPGLNVTKIIRSMLDPSLGLTTYDVFVYDIELDEKQNWDYVSIFRRICQTGLNARYFIEESTHQILNILEQIQLIGYFGGVRFLRIYFNGTLPSFFQRHLSKEIVEELHSERLSVIMDKIPLIIKACRDDLFKLDEKELKDRIDYDYQCCIGLLLQWYQRCLLQERCAHYQKLVCILSRVMMDTKMVEYFFDKTDKELAVTFSEWANFEIKHSTVFNFRVRMQDYLLFTDSLCVFFINEYGKGPPALINAPMLYGKHAENSVILRDLLNVPRFTRTDSSYTDQNLNLNNPNPTPIILNVLDTESNISLKFIPANHAKSFSFNRHFEADFGKLPSRVPTSQNNNEKGNANNANSINFRNAVFPPRPTKDTAETVSKFTPTEPCKNMNTALADILFRPKMPKEFRKRQKSKSMSIKINNCSNNEEGITGMTDEELKDRIQRLIATNDKYRDMRIPRDTERLPLNFLRSEIENYKSADGIIKMIQSKQSNKIDCLYNNLNAISIIDIMAKLSAQTTNDMSSTNEFSQLNRTRI